MVSNPVDPLSPFSYTMDIFPTPDVQQPVRIFQHLLNSTIKHTYTLERALKESQTERKAYHAFLVSRQSQFTTKSSRKTANVKKHKFCEKTVFIIALLRPTV